MIQLLGKPFEYEGTSYTVVPATNGILNDWIAIIGNRGKEAAQGAVVRVYKTEHFGDADLCRKYGDHPIPVLDALRVLRVLTAE